MEVAFQNEAKDCSVLVAGYVYFIDFQKMYQIRQNDISRQRKIKRDLASTTKKGIAGLRILSNSLKEEGIRIFLGIENCICTLYIISDISSTSMDRSESVLNLVMENLNTINITEENTPAN